MSVLFKDKITGLWKRAAATLIYASFPVGSIVAYGGSSDVAAPAGCMYCHGQVLNSADYPDLYDVIGTKFGVGDGSAGSFSLPELRGEFLRGAGTNSHSGQGSGGAVGTHQNATFLPFMQGYDGGTFIAAGPNGYSSTMSNQDYISRAPGYGTITAPYSADGGSYATNSGTVRPTNTSVNWIIKVVK